MKEKTGGKGGMRENDAKNKKRMIRAARGGVNKTRETGK